MNGNHPSLQNRIESCRGLLEVFQQERQMLQERQGLDPSSILGMLKLKLTLVETVADHRRAVQDEAPAAPSRREHVRELASLLEQLLVIERENQMLLRRLLEPGKPAAPAPPALPREAEPGPVPLLARLQHIRNRDPRPMQAPEMPRHAER